MNEVCKLKSRIFEQTINFELPSDRFCTKQSIFNQNRCIFNQIFDFSTTKMNFQPNLAKKYDWKIIMILIIRYNDFSIMNFPSFVCDYRIKYRKSSYKKKLIEMNNVQNWKKLLHKV